MIPAYLIIGNLLSFCCAVCIAISVMKKDKKHLVLWQIWDSFFGSLASLVLFSYSSFTTGLLCAIRNILAYKKKLTQFMVLLLISLCMVIGLYANNRGVNVVNSGYPGIEAYLKGKKIEKGRKINKADGLSNQKQETFPKTD